MHFDFVSVGIPEPHGIAAADGGAWLNEDIIFRSLVHQLLIEGLDIVHDDIDMIQSVFLLAGQVLDMGVQLIEELDKVSLWPSVHSI